MEHPLQGFEVEFANQWGKAYLVIAGEEAKADRVINYQVEMITHNDIPGLLPLEIREKDAEIKLFYNLDGLVTITDHISKNRPGANELILMLNSIASVILQCSNYFLDQNSFILDMDYIYVDPVTCGIKLLYLPVEGNHNINESFRSLVIGLVLNNVNIDVSEPVFLELLNTAKQKEMTIGQFSGKLQHLSNTWPVTFPSADREGSLLTYPLSQQEFVESSPPQVSQGLTVKSSQVKWTPALNKRRLILVALAAVSLLIAAASVFVDGGMLSDTLSASFKALGRTLMDSRNIMLLVGIVFIAAGLYVFRKGSPKAEKGDTKEDKTVKTGLGRRTAPNQMPPGIGENLFLDDGADETVLLAEIKYPRLKSLADGETVVINKPEFLLGRSAELCDYVINNKSVGRLHAKLRFIEGAYVISDLDSKNGTFLNGEGLVSQKDYKLKDNDIITLANMDYRFSLE